VLFLPPESRELAVQYLDRPPFSHCEDGTSCSRIPGDCTHRAGTACTQSSRQRRRRNSSRHPRMPMAMRHLRDRFRRARSPPIGELCARVSWHHRQGIAPLAAERQGQQVRHWYANRTYSHAADRASSVRRVSAGRARCGLPPAGREPRTNSARSSGFTPAGARPHWRP
jgi:hypothetical protein